jgi:hypothetical protein
MARNRSLACTALTSDALHAWEGRAADARIHNQPHAHLAREVLWGVAFIAWQPIFTMRRIEGLVKIRPLPETMLMKPCSTLRAPACRLVCLTIIFPAKCGGGQWRADAQQRRGINAASGRPQRLWKPAPINIVRNQAARACGCLRISVTDLSAARSVRRDARGAVDVWQHHERAGYGAAQGMRQARKFDLRGCSTRTWTAWYGIPAGLRARDV